MDNAKKITAVIVSLLLLVLAFFGGFFTHKLTRSPSVSSYDWAVSTIEENYVGEYSGSGNLTLPVDGYTAEELSLKALVAKLDPYSAYYTKSEYAAMYSDNAGNKSGIGISYSFRTGLGAQLFSVMGNSPAYESGLRAGDILVSGKANGQTTAFVKTNDVSAFITARADGEEFTLCTETSEYTVKKTEYVASYAHMFTNDTEWRFAADGNKKPELKKRDSAELDYLPDGIAYIRLTQFYGDVDGEFAELVREFNALGLKSMIIDLRNNGGGYLDSMQGIAGCFTSAVSSGKCIAATAKYKKGSDDFYCKKYSGNKVVPKDVKVYVLANSNTASASEALIGALVSYDFLKYEDIYLSDYSDAYYDWSQTDASMRVPRTYGKGIMQSTFVNRATGEALKLTTAKIYWQNGKCIHGVGLTTGDKCKSVPAEWVVTTGDTELRTAVGMIAAG